VFIIGCPRSGTTLLYRGLSEARPLWSIGGESRHIIERLHHPRRSNWESGALAADDLTPESKRFIGAAFEREAAPWTFWAHVNRLRGWLDRRSFWRTIKRVRGAQGRSSEMAGAVPRGGMSAIRSAARLYGCLRLGGDRPMRLLEKTPENCLRLPFLLEIFPDARIIHLIRDGRSNVSSLMEGWRRADLFPGYRVPERLAVSGVTSHRWAFALIPGWRELAASPLEEVCARQWMVCNEAVLDFRRNEGRGVPFLTVKYENLVNRLDAVLAEVTAFADVELNPHPGFLSESNIVSPPAREKWRHLHGEEIRRIEPLIAPTMERLGYLE
jgi:hypothetical protein